MKDFLLAGKIYFLNFRFTKYITKKQYFDSELKSAASGISRSYITTILFVAGIIGSFFIGGSDRGGMICIIWVILDLLIINPAIYYAVLPKPIGDHIVPEEMATDGMEYGSVKDINAILSKYDPVDDRKRRG